MRTTVLFVCLLAAATCSFGQQWEFGGLGGGGFLSNVNVSNSIGSATAGFQPGGAFGAFVGQSINPHISGEIRYEYLQNNLKLSSGGTSATFSGMAHAIHYDLLYHTNRAGSKVQGFVAVGFGLKVFRGTGTEQAYQPLSQYGYFTKTQQLEPMGSVGVGVRFAVAHHVFLRTEIRDFITPFPDQIIASPPNTKYGSILHDVVPMVAISYEH